MATQKKYPFKFLDAYNREDRDIFFGRDEEVETLYQMVFQTDLILIYGASGTGKTSLIQCGLAGKFQPYEWLALSIRRGDDLNESLEKALAYEEDATTDNQPADNLDWLDDSGSDVATLPVSPVAAQLKNLYLRHFKPVFLIFDQFEELYILGTKEEQRRFVETVSGILRIEQPVKIIISIREEYLGYLYEFEKKVPELLRKKLRIEPMNLEKVQTVVKNIGRLSQSNVQLRKGEEDAIGTGIFEKLKTRENTRTIELPYLQVFLDKLYLQISGDMTREADAEFTLAELEKTGNIGDVLRDFLDEQVQKNAVLLDTTPETIKKLLAPFVTLDGTKDPLSADMLHDRLPDLPKPFIDRSLQAFQNSRILRFNEKEQRYEVAHDSLARQIATYQDAEDVALQIAGQVIRTQMLFQEEKREFFTEKQLLFIDPFRSKLKIEQSAQEWIKKSIEHLFSVKQVEQKKLKSQLKRARQLQILLVLLFILSLAFLITVIHQYKKAKSESEKALAAQTQAENNLQQADSLRIVAVKNDSIAQKEAQKAKTALQHQIEAERNTKRQQLQTFMAQASEFRNKKQYDDAIKAYRNAGDLAENNKILSEINAAIDQCKIDKRDNDFTVAKERGLRLAAIDECKAAIPYLKAALAIRDDKAVKDALSKCQ